jgi:type VI protein secretion system component VasF
MDWLNNISTYAKDAASVYATVTGNTATVPASTAPVSQTATSQATPEPKPMNWPLIGGIAAALVVVLFFVLKRK